MPDYHAEIGYPDVPLPTGTFHLSPTNHAKREAANDRYGSFDLPTKIELTEEMYHRNPKQATGQTTEPHIFEITVEDGRVVKLGLRREYDDRRDIILIIKPFARLLITAWTNLKDDPHQTLDETKYATP